MKIRVVLQECWLNSFSFCRCGTWTRHPRVLCSLHTMHMGTNPAPGWNIPLPSQPRKSTKQRLRTSSRKCEQVEVSVMPQCKSPLMTGVHIPVCCCVTCSVSQVLKLLTIVYNTQNYITYWILDLFPSSGKGVGDTHFVGYIRKS
jgi:hypothetical protein